MLSLAEAWNWMQMGFCLTLGGLGAVAIAYVLYCGLVILLWDTKH